MLNKFRRVSKEIGGINAILYLIDRCLSAVSASHARLFRYYLIAQPVPDKPLLPAHRGAGVAVHRIEADDSRVADFPRPAKVIRFRYQQNALALSAYQDDAFVGCLWLNLGPYNEDEVRCRFAPEPAETVAWDYDVFVMPEHRMGLVFARLWDEANRILRDAGIRWSASRISAFNAASIAAHRRLGGRIVGSASFLKVGPFQLLLSGATPKVHVGVSPRKVPVMRFDVATDNAIVHR